MAIAILYCCRKFKTTKRRQQMELQPQYIPMGNLGQVQSPVNYIMPHMARSQLFQLPYQPTFTAPSDIQRTLFQENNNDRPTTTRLRNHQQQSDNGSRIIDLTPDATITTNPTEIE